MVGCYSSNEAHASVDSKPKQQNSCWWLINKTAICPTEHPALLYLKKLANPLHTLPFSEQTTVLTHFQNFSTYWWSLSRYHHEDLTHYYLSLWDASH